MANVFEKMLNADISRRDFLKGTLAASASVAGLSMAACGNESNLTPTAPAPEAPEATVAPVEHAPIVDIEEGGEWVSAACWHNCGGRCLNKALVKDGIVIRQKTDDNKEDTPDFPQQRACQRGRAQRMQVFGADRLKYPMKRKNWSIDDPHGELRGEDEWERISWDEAFTLTAQAIKKLYDEYGPETCFVLGGSQVPKVLQGLGGFTPRWGQVSWGAWPDAYKFVTGNGGYSNNAPDRFTLREQKLVILWGANPAVSSAGLPEYNYLQAHKAGTEYVVIDPRYTESIRPLEAQWIPIRPATDTAMILGMIQHIIANDLHDKEYLDKYCVGFDRDHMPPEDSEDWTYNPLERQPFTYKAKKINPDYNFYDYVMGEGLWAAEGPKTPEWASEICGVPAETIKELAVKYATTKPASIYAAGAPARINDGECFPHALTVLGMVCGQLGRGGASIAGCMHNAASNGGPGLVSGGGAGAKSNVPANPFPQKTYAMNNGEMWEAVLNGEHTMYKENGKVVKYPVNIHMIYQGMGGALNQRQAMTQGIQAYKKVDFALCTNYVLNTSAKYSDIVFPCTTEWERTGTLLTGNREALFFGQHIVEPMYEAKSDIEIGMGLADKMHELYPDEFPFTGADLNDISEWQQTLNKLAGATVTTKDGKVPLLTITADDVARYSEKAGEELTLEPQEGVITLEQFEKDGMYQVPNAEEFRNYPFKAFIEDPEANPVDTPSGKFEIYSQAMADYIEWVGFSSKDPLPIYPHITEGYEDGIANGRPFQLVTHHYQRRSHHVFDNLTWLREAFPQELWINADDAKALEIKTGDIVLLESPYGKVARPAYVTERIVPGVISLGEGAWAQLTKDGVDIAGATNTLSSPVPTGQGHTGFNSNNCLISKYSDQTIKPDCEWEKRIVFPEM